MPQTRRTCVCEIPFGIAVLICLTVPCAIRAAQPKTAKVPTVGQILFTSAGTTGIVRADGSGLRWLELDAPNQATWQVADFFSDGRLLLLSMEPRRDGPGRPFDEFYTQTPTHLWRYHLETSQLEELATKDRMAPFYTPALLIGDSQMLVQVVKDRVGQIYRMNLDGSNGASSLVPAKDCHTA